MYMYMHMYMHMSGSVDAMLVGQDVGMSGERLGHLWIGHDFMEQRSHLATLSLSPVSSAVAYRTHEPRARDDPRVLRFDVIYL